MAWSPSGSTRRPPSIPSCHASPTFTGDANVRRAVVPGKEEEEKEEVVGDRPASSVLDCSTCWMYASSARSKTRTTPTPGYVWARTVATKDDGNGSENMVVAQSEQLSALGGEETLELEGRGAP